SPRFDVSELQTSDVWFLGAPFGKTRRTCTIPGGKSLCFQIFGVEVSDIEPQPFRAAKEDQAAKAMYWADHFVDLFCEIDGVALSNLAAYRVRTGPITFNAPTPWIQGKIGGKGAASGD